MHAMLDEALIPMYEKAIEEVVDEDVLWTLTMSVANGPQVHLILFTNEADGSARQVWSNSGFPSLLTQEEITENVVKPLWASLVAARVAATEGPTQAAPEPEHAHQH